MNIAIIAANGRLGQALVAEALSQGHIVRAGIRGNSPFHASDQLEIIECDATNESDVEQLIRGVDVVFSAIGHVKASPDTVQTDATRVLVRVMNRIGIKRFVDVTGTGARVEGDHVSLVDWFLNVGVGIVDPARVKDGIEHLKVLQKSDLDWTTIRVLKLQNISPRPYALTLHGPTKWVVGREEVAKAMLEVATDHSFLKQAPILSKKR